MKMDEKLEEFGLSEEGLKNLYDNDYFFIENEITYPDETSESYFDKYKSIFLIKPAVCVCGHSGREIHHSNFNKIDVIAEMPSKDKCGNLKLEGYDMIVSNTGTGFSEKESYLFGRKYTSKKRLHNRYNKLVDKIREGAVQQHEELKFWFYKSRMIEGENDREI